VVSPVQFVVQVNTQVLIRFYNLNVHSLDAHWYRRRAFTTAEVQHQLLGLTGVDVEAVPLAPFQKVLVQFSVFPVIVGKDEADDCRVIRELLQVCLCCILSLQQHCLRTEDTQLFHLHLRTYTVPPTCLENSCFQIPPFVEPLLGERDS